MNSSYVLVNDLRYHYYQWNLGDGGQAVLLLHGLASNARIWERVAPYLVEAGLTPLAPDLRGHGLTDKPDGDYGFDTYARDLAAFLDTCNLEHPVLVGHSWGAMLALDYAARFAVGPRSPAGIVLVDGAFSQLNDAPGATWETTRDRLAPPRLAGTRLDDFLSHVTAPQQKWQPDEQAVAIILANFNVTEDEIIYPNLSFDHHMQIVRAMWEFKTSEKFRRVRCPVLMIPAQAPEPLSEGEKDHIRAKQRGIAQAQESIRDLRVQWMPDTIHDIPLQRPQELASLIIGFIHSLE